MDSDLLARITIDTAMCGGRPCIGGKHLYAREILDLLASGATAAAILADYSVLEPEDITAAMYYTARQTDHIDLKNSRKFLVDN